jgi:hypothetical protein
MQGPERIDPPFATGRQALCFAVVLAAILLLPAALFSFGAVTREDVYRRIPNEWGGFPFIHRQIFEEQGEIDILILGTSLLYQALDTPYLQQELTSITGRNARVVSFGTNWRCELLNYLLLRDLLQRRKVRMLVFSMPVWYQDDDLPHLQSHRWLLFGTDDAAWRGLPFRNRLTSYAQSVLGAPRHVLGLLRDDLVTDSPFSATLGAGKIEKGIPPAGFVRWMPSPRALRPGTMIYSSDTRSRFHFTRQPLNDYQMHFLRMSFELLERYRVPVVLVHVPLWSERYRTVVDERMPWPEVFGKDIAMVGVPPTTLFAGLSEAEMGRLFYNQENFENHHFNRNGNEFFTRTIAPAILQLYERHVPRF